jgi:flavodoxin
LKDNVIIYYYTNTGNTELMANTVSDKLEEAGKKCELVNIKTITGQVIIQPETAIGFFSPIYAGGTAPPFEKFIKKQVPATQGHEAFILSNGGADHPGNSNAYMVKKLTKKGFNIIGCGFTSTASSLAEEPKEGEEREDPEVQMKRAIEKARLFADKLIKDEKPWEYGNPSFGGSMMHGLFRLFYGFMGKAMEDMARKNEEGKNG